MPDLTPKILFEDTHLVVLDKPAGLLSQGEKSGEENLVDWLRQYFGRNYVGLIHRLDRNTSGIMVVAKRSKSADRLTRSLREGRLQRIYLGWVHGEIKNPVHWRHFLEKNPKTNRVTAFCAPPSASVHAPGHAKEAILDAKPVHLGQWQGKTLTLLEIRLQTGRTHQIRAQAAAEGHPLLGDTKYGTEGFEFNRPALHSFRLCFDHPMSGEWLRFEAPLPEDMRRIQPFK